MNLLLNLNHFFDTLPVILELKLCKISAIFTPTTKLNPQKIAILVFLRGSNRSHEPGVIPVKPHPTPNSIGPIMSPISNFS